MAKKKDERFVKVHEEGTGFGWLRTVWVDKQTGTAESTTSARILSASPDETVKKAIAFYIEKCYDKSIIQPV